MITGKQFRDMIISGANNIGNQKAAVDELNVFPVPDGDTGTNMSMTIGYALAELERLGDDVAIEKVAATASSSLLRGARGNSGVILSLIFSGFARGMQGQKEADAKCVADSLQLGVDAAYKAVMKPTEGTMLTVARVAAERAAGRTGDLDTVALFDYIIEVAKETLKETPEMLSVLKKAGVVDSGGKGLIVILEGMRSVLKDGVIIERGEGGTASESVGVGVYAEGIGDDLTDEYCTEFLVIKNQDADAVGLRKELEALGNSVLCVDDDDLIKCHVHTETPDRAIKAALKQGYLSGIKIENMLEQYMRLQSDARASEHSRDYGRASEVFEYAPIDDESEDFGFVAVSAGKGLATLFSDLGVDRTVEGGQSMNPSTDEILAAAQSIPAKTVFVFANNKNIIMSAEQAANLADRRVVVIPTRSIPQGVSAMLVFDPTMSVEENVIGMNEAADAVKNGSVTWAARDSNFDGKEIAEGEILALEGGKLAFSDTDITRTAVKLARRLIDKDSSFVTVIYGEGVSKTEADTVVEQIQSRAKNVEVTLVDGGQPVYYYYISVE